MCRRCNNQFEKWYKEDIIKLDRSKLIVKGNWNGNK